MTIHVPIKKIMIALHLSVCSCITCINLFLHTCINSFISYHENDLEVLMVATVCPVPKSDCRIKRYRMIKFAWSTCSVWGEADHM